LIYFRLAIQRERAPVANRFGAMILRMNFIRNYGMKRHSVCRWQMLGQTQMEANFSSLFVRPNGWMEKIQFLGRFENKFGNKF
jgi:hypothetical protein